MRTISRAAFIAAVVFVTGMTDLAQTPGRGGGRGNAEPPVRALMLAGGCCHNYINQSAILMRAVGEEMTVDWTVVYDGRGTTTRPEIYNQPEWWKGFDIVVHNECNADVDDIEYIRKITAAHKAGVPALVIHCAMHSYRAAEQDDWREFLGVTSRRHTAQHNISLKIADEGHPVVQGLLEGWTTPNDELYVIEKLWPNATALATAVSPEEGHDEYPVVWVNQYHGARVFGTTLGHSDATWDDPHFQDLVRRGFRWAVNK